MSLPASTVTHLRALTRKKTRETERALLAEGTRVVSEALASGASVMAAYYTAEALETHPALVAEMRRAAPESGQIGARQLATISDVVTSQGVIAVVRWDPADADALLAHGRPLLVACDALSDPGNLGSLLRTCAWFGVGGLLLGEGSVDAANPKVVRGSMGTLFRLAVAGPLDLPATLARARASGYRVIGTDAAAELRHDRAEVPERSIVVLGSEAHGLSDAVRQEVDRLVRIERYGQAESLNVAVACGVILADARRRGES